MPSSGMFTDAPTFPFSRHDGTRRSQPRRETGGQPRGGIALVERPQFLASDPHDSLWGVTYTPQGLRRVFISGSNAVERYRAPGLTLHCRSMCSDPRCVVGTD